MIWLVLLFLLGWFMFETIGVVGSLLVLGVLLLQGISGAAESRRWHQEHDS
jgi:hypothetical protein